MLESIKPVRAVVANPAITKPRAKKLNDPSRKAQKTLNGLMLSNIVFYPMIFLSGATIPVEAFPKGLHPYMQLLPLYHVVSLVRGLWFGGIWGDHLKEVAILVAMMVAGVLVSIKTFRWE